MKRTLAHGSLSALMLLGVGSLSAQTPQWHVENFGFFDNREVQSPYQHSQTLFGTRLGVELGVKRGPGSVFAGYAAVEEFGCRELAHKEWTMYCQYKQDGVTGAFGAFPRRLLHRDLPGAFLDDSIRYYTPNLYGALIQRTGEGGFAELYCNWRGRQSREQREIFEISADGEYAFLSALPCFRAGFNAQLTHFSVRKGKTSDKVYDKVMLNPYVSASAEPGFFDACMLTAGALVSFNRDRTDKVWKTPVGFMGDVKLEKAWFGLANHLYAGRPQLSDYERYGAALHQGNAYYRSGFYDRLEASAYLLREKNFNCRLSAAFHFTEGYVDNTQTLFVHILF